MILYRYFGSHGLESLKDKKLKTAKFSDLNDPFELRFRPAGTMTSAAAKNWLQNRAKSEVYKDLILSRSNEGKSRQERRELLRRTLKKMRKPVISQYPIVCQQVLEDLNKIADEKLRVLCFSSEEVSPYEEILMWSHYTKNHYGLRIGFEFPEVFSSSIQVKKIEYSPTRFPIDLTGVLTTETLTKCLAQTMATKSQAWGYEKEYRLLIPVRSCQSKPIENGVADFVSFDSCWVKCVDLGVRFPFKSCQDLLKAVRRQYPHVEWRKAEYHKDEYALDYSAF